MGPLGTRAQLGENLDFIRAFVARATIAGMAAASLPGCALELDGLAFRDDAGAAPPQGYEDAMTAVASPEAGGESDGGGVPPVDGSVTLADADVASPSKDAAAGDAPVVDGCAATESCANGIDDDCNGLVDCEDPACATQGYACVDGPPAGWTLAAFSAAARPGCPADLPSQLDVDVDPTSFSGDTACGCTCGLGSEPSCVEGNVSTKYGATNACNGGTNKVVDYPAGGGCVVASVSLAPYVLAEQPSLSGGSCTAVATVERPPTGATAGELCEGQTAFGAGCGEGQVCARAPAGFGRCVVHDGAAGCPPGPYGAAHTIGVLDDTRGCTACACSPPSATCAQGTWDFFANNTCSGKPSIVIPTNDQCTGTGQPASGTLTGSNRFTSVMSDVACAPPAPVGPIGSVELTGTQTVCCE